MADISRYATHNEYPNNTVEGRDLRHMLHPSTNLAQHQQHGPMVLQSAKGVYITDNHGKQYLEGMSGLWCTAIGYGQEELAKVAYEQMLKLNYSQLFAGRTNEPSVLLAEKLKEMAPFDAGRVFFGLSGSDANDTQIKLVWYYNNAIGKPEKKKIISRKRGYHGVTIASGSLTGLPPFHKAFDLPMSGVLHTTSPHFYSEGRPGESEAEFLQRLVDDLEHMIVQEGPETVAAFIAEPIMGAGGVIVPPENYFPQIQQVLDKYDIAFIDDEVICGFGRTGKPFGAQSMNIKPTTMSIAKALSSAYLPISAVLLPESMYEAFADQSGELGNFAHGFTYSGHPVCAAVALRNLQMMDEINLFDHAERMGLLLQQRLQQFVGHPIVGEVRGKGLIAALELVQAADPRTPFQPSDGVGAYCSNACHEAGLVLRNLGDAVAICPPLIINEAQIDELIAKLNVALNQTLEWVKKQGLL